MGLYTYLAKTKDAKTIKDKIEAGSKEEAIANIRYKGLFLIYIEEVLREKKDRTLFILRKGKHKGVKVLDMAFFARNLSVTLSSGIPLLRSLELISYQTESIKLANVLKMMVRDIKKGLSLHESTVRYPTVFSPLWTGIIEVGEASGNLPFVLEKLADFLDKRADFERKIRTALVYPTMVSIFSVIVVIAFFKFILPKFTEVFQQFDIELPLLTKLLFNMSNFINKNFIVIFVFFILLIIGFLYFKKHSYGRKFMDNLSLALPIISDLTITSILERFSSTFYILLESGVPIIYSIEVVSRAVGNSIIGKRISEMEDNIRRGLSLSLELSKIEIFPPLISEIARIGEETGNMPEMFMKVSQHYQKELTTKIEQLMGIFEPLIIFILGVVIGTIVIALFLPIFKLATLGGG
ncbi:MAG: type II secretion system F family protein [Candidatus Omnitrophica bacterium]|nr:type II secretion system F family protein [Candidatus Omnitrophota bacterium]